MPRGSSTPVASNLSSRSQIPPSSFWPSGAFPRWNTSAVFIISSYLHLNCPSEKAPSLLVRFGISLVLWLEFSHMTTFSLCHIYFALRCNSKTLQLVFLTLTQSSAYFFSLNMGNINVFHHFFSSTTCITSFCHRSPYSDCGLLFDSCPSCVTGI